MNNKEIEDGLMALGSDIKSLYEMQQEESSKVHAEINAIKLSLVEIQNKQNQPLVMPQVEQEIVQLKSIVAKLIEILQKIAVEKKLIEPVQPKKPEEELREVLAQVTPQARTFVQKEEVMKGYCVGCMDEMEIINISPEIYKDNTGEYKEGYCIKCGRKTYKKLK